jgi:hypothetical protein
MRATWPPLPNSRPSRATLLATGCGAKRVSNSGCDLRPSAQMPKFAPKFAPKFGPELAPRFAAIFMPAAVPQHEHASCCAELVPNVQLRHAPACGRRRRTAAESDCGAACQEER